MSVEQDIFLIGVTGSRKNITRMLNAAIRNVAAGDPIVESDDIEAVNLKLNYFTGREGHNIGIFDLLDEECMKDEAVIGKKEAFYYRVKACANCPFDCPNTKLKSDVQPLEYGSKEMEEYCPWPDPYYAEDAPTEPNRYIEVVRVEEGTNDYTAKFSWYLYESFGPTDWADWEDIARLYDCRVFVDDDYYRNGQFIRFECATIYEPGGGKHRFESGTTGKEYDEFMDKLAELYPERYRPIRARYLKEKEDEKERQHLEEERHIKLNHTVWSRFASWEEDGVKAINGVYDRLLKEAVCYDPDDPDSISAEDILSVLKVRAEKWKDVNDEFANCYENLVLSFNDDFEQKKKEFEARDDKWIDEILAGSDDEPTSQYPIDENGHAVIPGGTTRIDDFAFMNCDKLVSVSIPETVEEIGEGAFGGCENLKSVVLPGSLQRIEARAFADCISLKDIDIPLGVTVDAEAFMNCPRESVLSHQTLEKTILGTGIFNLDIIVVREYPEWPAMRPFAEKEVLREVGGTCGNVMCMLATLGWKVRPVACLDDSAEGWKITEDLKEFGCDCTYVSNTPGGGTTLLRCTHKKDADGKHVMSVRTGSPGGSRFPKRHFLRARDEAPAFLAALKDASAVFFFDDPAAGNRVLARGLKERGALVYFEPSKIASNADLEAVGLSDIIKFSDENVPDVSFADAYPDKVFIQTMGPDGVKIKEKGGAWYVIEGVKNNTVVDAEGAGDTFTSAFINAMADGKTVADAAREAMMMASRSVGFLGSKGLFRR